MKKSNQLSKLQAAYKMAQLERELSAKQNDQKPTCLYCWTPIEAEECSTCGNTHQDLSQDSFISLNDYNDQAQYKHYQAV